MFLFVPDKNIIFDTIFLYGYLKGDMYNLPCSLDM